MRPALGLIRLISTTAFGHDAFISYARHDARRYAEALWDRLERAGLTVALDRTDLNAGDPLADTLRRRVRRSSYLLLLDSPGARRSRYVSEEVGVAVRRNRPILRIHFPAVADSDNVWHLLSAFRQRLLHEIWIDEDDTSDPIAADPADETVAELLKVHRSRRVRFLFWTTFGTVLTLALAALATVATARIARARALDAIVAFRNPALSLAAAEAKVRNIFVSRCFPVFDFFAADEHWQLRNTVATTVIRRRTGVDVAPPYSQVPCQGTDRAPAPAHDMNGSSCVARSTDGRVRAFVRAVSSTPNGGPRPSAEADPLIVPPQQLRLWESDAGWTDWSTVGSHEFGVALGRDRVATVTSGEVTLWLRVGRRLIEIARRSMDPIIDARFSNDGAVLLILWTPFAQQRYVLSAIDAGTGASLEDQSVSLREGASSHVADGAAHPECGTAQLTTSLTVSGNLAAVCAGGHREVFEITVHGDIARYAAPALSGSVIVGAMPGRDERSVAYWTANSDAIQCSDAQSCREVDTSPDSDNMGLSGVLAIRNVAPVSPNGVLIESRTGIWRCQPDSRSGCKLAAGSEYHLAHQSSGPVALHRTDRSAPTAVLSVDERVGLRVLDVPAAVVDHVMASAADGRLVELDEAGNLRLWELVRGAPIPPGQIDATFVSGATVTAAAFAERGSSVAVALSSVYGSFVYVRQESWQPWLGAQWRGIRTIGPALVVKMPSADGELTTFERWHRTLVRRTYPSGRWAVVGQLAGRE